MKKCSPKTCIFSFLAVLVFLFGYDWLVHGNLLTADYEATASLWRPAADMQSMWVYCIAYHVALAAVLTCFFKKFRKGFAVCHCGPECQCGDNCPCKQAVAAANSCCPIQSGGVCFGVKVGLILALSHATLYILLPIPGALAVKWFVAYLVQGIGAGAVLGIVCGSMDKGNGKSCGTTSCSTEQK
jgi:hypothetical protein